MTNSVDPDQTAPIVSWRFKGLNVDKKNYVGHDVRNSLRGFENNKGADQSALPQ